MHHGSCTQRAPSSCRHRSIHGVLGGIMRFLMIPYGRPIVQTPSAIVVLVVLCVDRPTVKCSVLSCEDVLVRCSSDSSRVRRSRAHAQRQTHGGGTPSDNKTSLLKLAPAIDNGDRNGTRPPSAPPVSRCCRIAIESVRHARSGTSSTALPSASGHPWVSPSSFVRRARSFGVRQGEGR